MNGLPLIALVGYGSAGLAWAALTLLLGLRRSGRGLGAALVALCAIELAWAAATAFAAAQAVLATPAVVWLEALRMGGWSAFVLAMLRGHASRRLVVAATALLATVIVAHAGAILAAAGPLGRFGPMLLCAVLTLVCLEQVYRNSTPDGRWASKFLYLAIGAMAAFDLVLYADALLFARADARLWTARGYAHALVAPLVAVSATRIRDWRLDVRVSRAVVFHTATLLFSGMFLLALAAVGYGLQLLGGEWTSVAATLLLFAGLVAVGALSASGKLRATLRTWVARHFYTNRFDYRAEWLRLTGLVARADDPDAPDGSLAQRALKGMLDLVGSPGGTLWQPDEQGVWTCSARQGVGDRPALSPGDPLLGVSAAKGRIVEIDEWRRDPAAHEALALPPWLAAEPQAWLLVPLRLHEETIALVQLQRPLAPVPLDWEVRDLLETAGRQVAGHLAVRSAVERLVQARQFDSFNRMSAFIVHDLKNLVSQLSLLMGNAARHRDKPEFQRDMLETVENVLGRMQAMLMQLGPGTRPIEPPAPLRLLPVLEQAVRSKRGARPEPELEAAPGLDSVVVLAHADRLERIVRHLLQNAIEATPPQGSVILRAVGDATEVRIDVVDTGRGMPPEFVETRLFRAFASTKPQGMGLGVFESREYLHEIDGTLRASSREGRGTTFTIRLPVHRATAIRAVQEHA